MESGTIWVRCAISFNCMSRMLFNAGHSSQRATKWLSSPSMKPLPHAAVAALDPLAHAQQPLAIRILLAASLELAARDAAASGS